LDDKLAGRRLAGFRLIALSACMCVASFAVAGCGDIAAGTSPAASKATELVKDPGRVSPPAANASKAAGGSVTGPAAGPKPSASAQTAAAPSPAPSASQYAAGTTPAQATATLASTCLVPGRTQTLTVRSTPTYGVTFDAQYADGNDGRKYGGVGTGHIDSQGNYVASWVVAPGTAAGNVVVWVSVAGGSESAFRQPTFVVESAC